MNNRSWNFWKKKKKEKRRITKREKSQDPCNFNGPLFLEERSSNGCRKWREREEGARGIDERRTNHAISRGYNTHTAVHTVARESICTVLQKNFSQLENPAFGRSLRAHNGLYKWAISFFNRVRNFNFHSFFDENNPNHKNDIPLPIYSRKYFAKFLELYPSKEYIYIYFVTENFNSFSRNSKITSILLFDSFYYLQRPVEYFREPLYANAGLVPTPFHRDTSRPATEAFFQAFPRLLHSIRRL